MKLKFIISITLFFTIFFSKDTNPQSNNEVVFNYIFLIDCSGSMQGMPSGSENSIIFPKVKETLNNFINSVDNGNIFIFPFSSGLETDKVRNYSIKTNSDVKQVQEYITKLTATGSKTWIYQSFHEVIDYLKQLGLNSSNNNSINLYYLYTDGLNNGRGSMQELFNEYNLSRGENDWLYYTTLGIQLNSADRRILEGHRDENVVLTEEGKDKISPILLVRVLLPYLNFGNLKTDPISKRSELFVVHGKDKISNDFNLKLEPQFLQLTLQGANIKFNPSEFKPEEETILSSQLFNVESIKDGKYSGEIFFKSSQPNIYVVPDKIKIDFLFEEPREVNIEPPNNEKFPIHFDLTPEKNLISTQKIIFDFNNTAIKEDSKLNVIFKPDANNPSEIMPGKNIFIDKLNISNKRIDSKTNLLVIELKYTNNLKAGDYRGKIIFEGDDLNILGNDLKNLNNYSISKFLPWTLRVNASPLPLWVWILIIFFALAILGFLIYKYYDSKLPRLQGTIEVTAPPQWSISINLSRISDIKRKKGIIIGGEKADYLQDLETKLTIVPRKEKGRSKARLIAMDGVVKINNDQVVNEWIYDNDKIEVLGKIETTIIYNNYKDPRP